MMLRRRFPTACAMALALVVPLIALAAMTQQQKLTAADAASNDQFGDSVSISGDTAVVGAPWEDGAGSLAGSAYVFQDDQLAVDLVAFRASRRGIAVLLRWATLSEIDHAGFRVLREEPSGELVNLTPRLIRPRAPGGELDGGRYRFVDWRAPPERVRYWLEDVDTTGHVTRHGPVDAPAARTRPIPLPRPPGAAPDTVIDPSSVLFETASQLPEGVSQ